MPAATPVCRAALRQDLTDLVALERECFDPPWGQESLETIVLRQDAWVADSEGALVAEALFQTVLDESELLRLAVAVPWRRGGIGRMLLSRGLADLHGRGIERCFLEVRADNAPALGLYRSLGFRSTGRRPRYYPDGTDALLLGHRLGSP